MVGGVILSWIFREVRQTRWCFNRFLKKERQRASVMSEFCALKRELALLRTWGRCLFHMFKCKHERKKKKTQWSGFVTRSWLPSSLTLSCSICGAIRLACLQIGREIFPCRSQNSSLNDYWCRWNFVLIEENRKWLNQALLLRQM